MHSSLSPAPFSRIDRQPLGVGDSERRKVPQTSQSASNPFHGQQGLLIFRPQHIRSTFQNMLKNGKGRLRPTEANKVECLEPLRRRACWGRLARAEAECGSNDSPLSSTASS